MNKTCEKGHKFEKTSSCPTCPICSKEELNKRYSEGFPRIGSPAYFALKNVGITEVSQLTNYSEEEILNLHGMGPKAVGILKLELKKLGKNFKSPLNL